MQLPGWGSGGRGNIPSPAQRFRSRLEFSEPERLTAIVRWQVEAAERANNENSADLPAGQVTLVFTNLLQVPDTPIAAGHLSS